MLNVCACLMKCHFTHIHQDWFADIGATLLYTLMPVKTMRNPEECGSRQTDLLEIFNITTTKESIPQTCIHSVWYSVRLCLVQMLECIIWNNIPVFDIPCWVISNKHNWCLFFTSGMLIIAQCLYWCQHQMTFALIESIKTTSMEDVSTRVLEKNKKYLRR